MIVIVLRQLLLLLVYLDPANVTTDAASCCPWSPISASLLTTSLLAFVINHRIVTDH